MATKSPTPPPQDSASDDEKHEEVLDVDTLEILLTGRKGGKKQQAGGAVGAKGKNNILCDSSIPQDEDAVKSLVAGHDAFAADGGMALNRAKKIETRNKFVNAYVRAFLATRQRPYHDAALESALMEEYYAPLGLVAEGGGGTATTAGDSKQEGTQGLRFKAPEYAALNHLLSSTFVHANRRIGLWAIIDRQRDGTLRCAYSDALIETDTCLRQCKADEEHLVPQSWHKGSKLHPGTDMHQIFIVTKPANGSRGNRIFGPCSTTVGGGGKAASSTVGGLQGLGPNGEKYFLPHHNTGAVCRATLYILAAYRATFHQPYFPKDQMQWLQQMAATAPVTDWEKHRNAELFRLQGNRNPFVDYPHWSLEIDFTLAFQ